MKYQLADIPLTGGLNLSADPQAMPPGDFALLDNAEFYKGATISPRSGHDKLDVWDTTFSTSASAAENTWLYGYGYYDPAAPYAPFGTGRGKSSTTGQVRGLLTRDNELVAWDGWRALTYSSANGNWASPEPSTGNLTELASQPSLCPVVTATERSLAGIIDTSAQLDTAYGNKRVMTIWHESNNVYVSIRDRATNELLYSRILVFASGSNLRITYSRWPESEWGWFFITAVVGTDLKCYVFPEQDIRGSIDYPVTGLTVNSLSGATTYYDVRPLPNGRIGLLAATTTPELHYYVIKSDETTELDTNVSLSGTSIDAAYPVALAVHPDSTLMFAWTQAGGGTAVRTAFHDAKGNRINTNAVNVGTATGGCLRLACEFRFLQEGPPPTPLPQITRYQGIVAFSLTTGLSTKFTRVRGEESVSPGSTFLGDSILTHQGIRVGDIPYFVVGYVKTNTIQPELCVVSADVGEVTDAANLRPVALNLRGTAVLGTSSRFVASSSCLPSASGDYPEALNATEWAYAALGARVVLTTTSTTQKDYSANAVELNFLPELRYAQAGRSTYIAGGVVQEYDGAKFRPAGFLQIPEITLAVNGGAGSLTASSTYTYRVYLEERNAAGEWIRSAALTKAIALGVGETAVDITVPATPFEYRTNWRWSIYRGTTNSTLLKLLRQDSPASGSFGARGASQTITDTAADSTLASKALDPSPATTQSGLGLLDMMAPPSCTIIAAGNERIWFAGGGIENGKVAYTRLFDPGEVALWNEALNVQVDRTDSAVTGLGFLQNALCVFKQDKIFTVTGTGPDNLGRGVFNEAVPVLTDVGCISPESVGTCPIGVVFQSKYGPRALTAGSGVVNIGEKVNSAFDESVARKVSFGDSTIRFHGPTDTYTMCYYDPGNVRWSRWTYGAQAVARWKTTNAVVPLPHMTDCVWVEDKNAPGDAGQGCPLAMDFGWLKTDTTAGEGKVKWFGFVGKYLSPHFVTGTVKYDYRDKVVDNWTWWPAATSPSEDFSYIDHAPLDITKDERFIGVISGGSLEANPPFAQTSALVAHYPGGPYVFAKGFNRQRTPAFRLYIEFNHVFLSDDPQKLIKASGSGASITGLTVAYKPSIGNGRAKWGSRTAS